MILDSTNLYSDDQALTGDAASTNIIDHGANRDVGPGNPLRVSITITEAFDNLTSLDITFQTDDDSAFGSVDFTMELVAIPLASLVAGASFSFVIPRPVSRYTRLNYDVNGSNPANGKITAGIVYDEQANDLS